MRRAGHALLCVAALAMPRAGAADVPVPADPPPPGYDSAAFVDSAGCVFLRVRLGTEEIWAPRYKADGTQLCGLIPTATLTPEPETGADPSGAALAGAGDPAAEAEPASAAPDDPAPGFYVQAGAFGVPENVARVQADFAAQGWGVQARPAGRLTLVLAGPFTDAAAAQEALRIIRRSGMPDAFVLRSE